MKALNYCRQYTKQLLTIGQPAGLQSAHGWVPDPTSTFDLIRSSVKFILPQGGRVIDDRQMRALDVSEKIHLPYPVIALEYEALKNNRSRNPDQKAPSQICSRRLVLAYEAEEYIMVRPVFWYDQHRVWVEIPECALPRKDYLTRGVTNPEDGTPSVVYVIAKQDERVSTSDYADEVEALLHTLNVLQCANVRSEQLPPTKPTEKVKKDALPFDSYHVLTVDLSTRDQNSGESLGGTHRSPREHLRRGHIRRYQSGIKIFVQATVVNAGVGGHVSKDYRMTTA